MMAPAPAAVEMVVEQHPPLSDAPAWAAVRAEAILIIAFSVF